MGYRGPGFLGTVLNWYFYGVGHILIVITSVLYVPSLIVFAEIERCQPPGTVPYDPTLFTCKDGQHSIVIAAVVVGVFSA